MGPRGRLTGRSRGEPGRRERERVTVQEERPGCQNCRAAEGSRRAQRRTAPACDRLGKNTVQGTGTPVG